MTTHSEWLSKAEKTFKMARNGYNQLLTDLSDKSHEPMKDDEAELLIAQVIGDAVTCLLSGIMAIATKINGYESEND